MDTKEAKEFIEKRICESPQKDQLFNLLERGEENEKYKAIVDELENKFQYYWVKDAIKAMKQKYFPKPVKKTITIEVEADNKDVLEGESNFVKAFFERNKDVLQCRYKVKEPKEESTVEKVLWRLFRDFIESNRHLILKCAIEEERRKNEEINEEKKIFSSSN